MFLNGQNLMRIDPKECSSLFALVSSYGRYIVAVGDGDYEKHYPLTIILLQHHHI